jgi:hypothetical protein
VDHQHCCMDGVLPDSRWCATDIPWGTVARVGTGNRESGHSQGWKLAADGPLPGVDPLACACMLAAEISVTPLFIPGPCSVLQVADTLLLLSKVYESTHRHAEAHAALQRSLDIQVECFPEHSMVVAGTQLQVASLAVQMARLQEACELLTAAVATHQHCLGKRCLDFGPSACNSHGMGKLLILIPATKMWAVGHHIKSYLATESARYRSHP